MQRTSHSFSVPMKETMDALLDRLLVANANIDSEKNNYYLKNLEGNIVNIGTGGSYVSAAYSSKVLENYCNISLVCEPRDILYSHNQFDNLVAYSWSGQTYGITKALKRYPNASVLVHANEEILHPKEIRLYHSPMSEERSFISIASTLIPMGELLKYYLSSKGIDGEKYLKDKLPQMYKLLKDEINQIEIEKLNSSVFEIMTGDNTYTASRALDSTFTEAGLGIPVIHEKYDYCHGRSTLAHYHHNEHTLIYLINGKSPLDDLLISLSSLDYKNTIILNSHFYDPIIGEYFLTLQTYLLCARIAEVKKLDISQVDYNRNVVSKLYRYNGNL